MKNLKPNRWIVIAAILIILMLSLMLFWPRCSPRPISVAMSGTSGSVVAGEWTVDGVRGQFRGTLPTNFIVTARSLVFALAREGGSGSFKLQLTPHPTFTGPFSFQSDYGIAGYLRFVGDHEDSEKLFMTGMLRKEQN